MTKTPGHRIVCAAVRLVGSELVIAGARHWDSVMRRTVSNLTQNLSENLSSAKWEQGFIDNRYNYLTRQEAWKVAENAGQIIRRVGGDEANGGTLYSENLY